MSSEIEYNIHLEVIEQTLKTIENWLGEWKEEIKQDAEFEAQIQRTLQQMLLKTEELFVSEKLFTELKKESAITHWKQILFSDLHEFVRCFKKSSDKKESE